MKTKQKTTIILLTILTLIIILNIQMPAYAQQPYYESYYDSTSNPNRPSSEQLISKTYTYQIPVNSLNPSNIKKYISNMNLSIYPKRYESKTTHNKVDVFLLTDVSLSMVESKDNTQNYNSFNKMKSALKQMVKLIIKKTGRVGLIEFSTNVIKNAGLSKNVRVLNGIINNYSPINGTDISGAMKIAIDILNSDHVSSGTKKAIVLLTDGKNDRGDYRCIKRAKQAGSDGIPIYTIAYHSEGGTPDTQLLEDIAQDSGGEEYEGGESQIKNIFTDIGETITSENPKDVSVYLNNVKLYPQTTQKASTPMVSNVIIQIPPKLYRNCYDVDSCKFTLKVNAILNMSKINTSLNVTLRNAEICDNKDDNGDGIKDNGLGTFKEMYVDNDSDSFGNQSNHQYFCINQTKTKCTAVPEGQTNKTKFNCQNLTYEDPKNSGNQYNKNTYINLSYNQKTYVTPIAGMFDCNDHLSFVHPGANELCDGRLDNCGGTLPKDEQDIDKDGYLACTGCDNIKNWVKKDYKGVTMLGCKDCNDTNPNINPGIKESQVNHNLDDTIDNNCNSHADYGETPYYIAPTSSNCFVNVKGSERNICDGKGNWANKNNHYREKGTASTLKVKVTIYNIDAKDKNNRIITPASGSVKVYAVPNAGSYKDISKLPKEYFSTTKRDSNGYYDISLNRYWGYTVYATYSYNNGLSFTGMNKITLNGLTGTINIRIDVSSTNACSDQDCGIIKGNPKYCGCYETCSNNELGTYQSIYPSICNGKTDGTAMIIHGSECPSKYPKGCIVHCCSGGVSPLPPIPNTNGLNFTNTTQVEQISKIIGYLGNNMIIKIIMLK